MIDELLQDAAVVAAASSVRADGSEPADAIARAAWSVIAEPGDGVAGTLISQVGAVEAMRFALDDRLRSGSAGGVSFPRADRALKEARDRWRLRASTHGVRDALEGARDVGATLLLPGDVSWPTSLDDLGANAPSALWVRGDARLLAPGPHLSIVGARASSSYGELIAAEISGDLADSGTVIVSGGAYGIDGAVHRAALGVDGSTVAFLAGGVDRAYPAGHASLFRRIAEQGAVVSELPCGAAPTKWRFLARNRLIAALGDATVVVEAGWRSGSLNTAGHASTLGRPLGAVPGPVTSAASAGCHRLLREYDAVCVTSSADVRELCGHGDASGATARADDPRQVRLLDAMSARTAVTSAELSRRSGLAKDTVSSMLGLLELDGVVERAGEGWRRVGAKHSSG
ncbi:DNA-processing protein DprA [Microbacterium sp.]|uniref:DNA-processing protein DprA n=1 Tax=Microbacterium sp. TaxID=51671 RepID=UPI002FDF702E